MDVLLTLAAFIGLNDAHMDGDQNNEAAESDDVDKSGGDFGGEDDEDEDGGDDDVDEDAGQ